MMKNVTAFVFFALVSSVGMADVPHTFHANQPAVAAEVNANFNYLNSEIGNVNSKVNENTSDIQENKNDISDLNSNLSTLNSAVSAVSSEVEGNFDFLNDEIENTNSIVSENMLDIQKNANDISLLDSAISSLYTSLLWLEGVVNTAVDAIADLTDRVNVLENQSGGGQSDLYDCSDIFGSASLTYNHISLPVGTIFEREEGGEVHNYVIAKVPVYDVSTGKKYVITYPASSHYSRAEARLISLRNVSSTFCELPVSINGFKIYADDIRGVFEFSGYSNGDYRYSYVLYFVGEHSVYIRVNENAAIELNIDSEFLYDGFGVRYGYFFGENEHSSFDFSDVDISEIYVDINAQPIFDKISEFLNYIYVEEVQP